MRKALPLLALAILSSGNALAASPSVGTAAVPFLLLPAGAREVALGGTGVAASEDANAMLWNPGLMAKNRHNSATFMHSAYLENSMYDFAAVNWKLDDRQALGVSAQYFSAGKINSTDDAGQDIGTIRPYDIAVSAGYSRTIGGWGLGVSGKAIQSKIINTAKTFAMDLGVSPPELLDGRLRLGAAYTNLGAKIRYNSVDEKLPAAIRLGAGYKLTQGLTLSSDIALPNAGKNYITLGAEMGLPVGGDMGAALRAGYSTQPDTDGYSGLSAGAGFKTSSYGIDYAFVPFGALGNTHRFSVTFYWDKGAAKTARQDKKKAKTQPARKTAIQPASTTSYDGYTVPQPASPITTRQRKYIPATIKTP